MDNYFTDNEDIQFYLNDVRLKDIFELREKGYTENHAYPFAPETLKMRWITATEYCLWLGNFQLKYWHRRPPTLIVKGAHWKTM